MIDPQDGKLIRLADVPGLSWLPTRRANTRLSISTVYDWAGRGLRGLKLETVSVGNVKCTTEAALLRFFERLNQPPQQRDGITPSQQRKAENHAKAVLDRMGI